MPDYLVFEAAETPGAISVDGNGRVQYPSPDVIVQYRNVGGVRAPDVDACARAVVGATRRVGKYAIIEAHFVDFTTDLSSPESESLRLNP